MTLRIRRTTASRRCHFLLANTALTYDVNISFYVTRFACSSPLQMQQVFDTLDPQWPRESAFFDVKIATTSLALEEENGKDYVPPSPVLVVDLLHSDAPEGKGKKAKQANPGENFVTPLGSVRINILDIITGKAASIDDWYDLPEQGALRVMVEVRKGCARSERRGAEERSDEAHTPATRSSLGADTVLTS